ncbi:ABC transporter ATP-binding protein [Clostridium felsineum]|uniref:ABC transporter ATP-binding protein n=1 Tax=Clostridium felsineum TaxID=36839 RepID=UPI00098C88F3|nr:ABC transporter ATP-binding protein [Clostridium felsineum]URZ18133.1 Vitamin B12 import ATP-binding protein BtuD [Clostridium felsineum DSM 794]
MENILEVKNVTKNYKGFSLNNMNFTLEKGYIMGFIGSNGAGKSTTIKLIMNLVKKNSGEIKVFGFDNVKNEKEIKEKIGFVYDETYAYEDLNLIQMKNIIARFYKKWSNDTFNNYITSFSLPRDKKIKELSKGMKIKYSLAIALSHEAELIIMDEPTSGLDPVFRNELLDIMQDIIQDENKSILFSTHITTDLEKIADYITFINDGKIIFSEDKDSIMEKYKIAKGDKEVLNKSNRNNFIGIRENEFGFQALTDDEESIKRTFGEKVIFEKANLEDIMVYTVKGFKNV